MRTTVFEKHTREGSGEPLVLLHGGGNHWVEWRPVIERLSTGYDVIAPDMAGHASGPPFPAGVTTIDTFADSVEAAMDSAGLDTAHIAGNSLGGWTAMEMARRGRARSVVAFSPAGGWPDASTANRVGRFLRATQRQTRLGRLGAELAMKPGFARRAALRKIALHGENVATNDLVTLMDVVLALDLDQMLSLLETRLSPYPTGVPTLIAWSEKDRLVPMPTYSDPWREAAPHAEFRVLPGVGHVPMYDNPQLVADTIHDWITGAR